MKRFILLLCCIVMVFTANAQVEIQREDGRIIKEGETIELIAEETELFPGYSIVEYNGNAPYLVNMGEKIANVEVTIAKENSNDNNFSWCMSGSCAQMNNPVETRTAIIPANGKEGLSLHCSFEKGVSQTVGVRVKVKVGEEERNFLINFVYSCEPVLVVKVNDTVRLYGEQNPKFIISYEGFVNGDNEGIIVKQPLIKTVANVTSAVGSYQLEPYGLELLEKKYKIQYVPGTMRVEKAPLIINVDNCNMVYGDAPVIPQYHYEGFRNNDSESCLLIKPFIKQSITKNTPAGKYEIVADGAKAKNYSISYESGTYTIEKRDLFVALPNVERKYGDENPSVNFIYTGFVNNDDESVIDKLPSVVFTADKSTPIGEYSMKLEGGVDNNYSLRLVDSAKLLIKPADLKVIANNVSRKYFANEIPLTCSYEGFKNQDDVMCLLKKPVLETEVDKQTPVGQYAIKVSGAEAENYDITFISGIYKISKCTLQVDVADTYTRKYGEDNPKVELKYSGFVNKENITALTKVPEILFTATSKSDVGIYEIKPYGGIAKNYEFVYGDGKLIVEKADQQIIWRQNFDDVEIGEQVYLEAVSSSGLPVEYLVSDDNVASVYVVGDHSVLDCFKVGSFILRAAQSGNMNYHAAERVSKQINIVPTGIDGNFIAKERPFRVRNKQICFNDTIDLQKVSVYTVNGLLLFDSPKNIITVQSGVYLIDCCGVRYKVFVK